MEIEPPKVPNVFEVESLVWKEGEVRKFYREIFGDIEAEPHHVGIVFLNTRKKYYPKEAQPFVVSAEFIERLFIRNIGTPVGENEFVRKVKRLDPPEGAFTTKLKYGKLPYFPPEKKAEIPEPALKYFEKHNLRTETYFHNGKFVESLFIDIPKETMGIYASLCVHDAMRGTMDFIIEAMKMDNQILHASVECGDVKSLLHWFSRANVHIYSSTHKKVAVKKYFILDVDTNDELFAGRVYDLFVEKTGIEPALIIKTHGGYHLIYDRTLKPDTEYARSLGNKGANLITIARKLFSEEWKKTAEKLGAKGYDVVEIKVKVPMSPVPGTMQGGWRVTTLKGF